MPREQPSGISIGADTVDADVDGLHLAPTVVPFVCVDARGVTMECYYIIRSFQGLYETGGRKAISKPTESSLEYRRNKRTFPFRFDHVWARI